MTVAARFSSSDVATTRRVEDYVAGCTDGVMATAGVNLLEDLAELPHVVIRDVATFDVVFDARPGSRLWKDWMVYLTRDLTSSFPNPTFCLPYPMYSRMWT